MARYPDQTRHLEVICEIAMLGTDTDLDLFDSIIVRFVVLGATRRSPYHMSSLAAATRLSLPTIHRRIRNLHKLGYVERRRQGSNIYLHPREKAISYISNLVANFLTSLSKLG